MVSGGEGRGGEGERTKVGVEHAWLGQSNKSANAIMNVQCIRTVSAV